MTQVLNIPLLARVGSDSFVGYERAQHRGLDLLLRRGEGLDRVEL